MNKFASSLVRPDPSRITQLDGIRGLACLLVLAHHYFTGVLGWELQGIAKYVIAVFGIFLLSGVDLFFVLSGFLVGGIVIDNFHKTNFLKVFYLRRVCRIFPVYFLVILSLPAALALLSGIDFFDKWLLEKPLPYWSYLTFMQSYLMGLYNTSGPKWAAISWSVSVEEQFYLLLPFLMVAIGKKNTLRFALLAVIAAPILRAYFFDNIGFYAGYMFFPGRMDSIFWGVLLAYFVRSERYKRMTLAEVHLMVVTALLLIVVTIGVKSSLINVGSWQHIFYTLIALIYSIFILAAFDGRIKILVGLLKNRFLVLTGSLSYAIYMFHQMVNGLVHGYFFSDQPVMNSPERLAATLLSIGVVYVLAYLSFVYLEQPIRSWGHGFRYKD